MLREKAELTAAEIQELDLRLIRGVVGRASTLAFVYAAVFGFYGFTSISFLHLFDPTISVFDNVWPRLLFNSLPLILMGLYFRRGRLRPQLKAWIWAMGLPFIFFIACLINVWELMWRGYGEVYLYVHAANIFILTTSLIVVSPPMRYTLGQMGIFIAIILAPVAYILSAVGQTSLLFFVASENLIAIPVVIFVSYLICDLRYKIAYFDLQKRKQASSFLGAEVAGAIYDDKAHLLENRSVEALVVQMDIRDFTHFYRTHDIKTTREFMRAYHALVSREIGVCGGYWHKSVGDAQLITFGATDEGVADLSVVPGIESEVSEANARRKSLFFTEAITVVKTIIDRFEDLKVTFGIDSPMSLGVGIAYGVIEIGVHGDASYKRELDIEGDVVIRCSRLEEFTKHIRKEKAPQSSVVVVSPELFESAKLHGCEPWIIRDFGVRNYPDIEVVFYRVFGASARERSAA